MCTALPVVSPTLVTSAAIALLKPSLWYSCLCGTSWGAEGCGKVCYGHHLFRIYHLVKLFFRPTPLGFRQVIQHVQLHVA
jgi:hypothetical protein